MNLRHKSWRLIAGGVGIIVLLVAVRSHWMVPPLREPDAVIWMKTTGYCACKHCCSWKIGWFGLPVFSSGPLKGKLKIIGQTASGRMARPGTVAVDPEVFPMGTKFNIPGYGWGVARDTGGDIKGRHLDLFFWRHRSAEKWGVKRKKVKVWYPRK